ncbi:hypothetical protein pEaSNUABM14_00199 [Erwinia phage pEa_SNUABM_14]|uniref:Uncharacterized protein n=1 Tax=Erwinia phage pEa_SNUABM_7 TaxID=2866695 RepID=A0AAE7WUJ1_9CAUD|nr:hypothetical protein MPK74_gp200 [Erwinia phage pEa_SNUABM_7]QYW03159.1 hypothetical protein pEaSNUABM13_00200 [Erwinia phage pEa_SNUABM_13]QYW04524.1 hypothetical protein pEaSNUABM14_00199 [Erwinia phage pEa_SNUABM_14]QYW04868.1 hypothetical protein pEaSNUABM7_00200 [Erwinia phage pEa_SNUABM_7]
MVGLLALSIWLNTWGLNNSLMEMYVSLSREVQMGLQALSAVLGVRALDHKLLSEEPGFVSYAYVAFASDDSGDYVVRIAKLRRQGISSNSYKVVQTSALKTKFSSVYNASMAMEKLGDNAVVSQSAPPPIQSAVFLLSDFKIQMTPGLQHVVDLWCDAQEIAPLRYAVINPRTETVEVAFRDASAYNSDIIQKMLRDSLYAALGDYSAGKEFTMTGRV